MARRQGVIERGDVPGILFLEIDGLAAPVLALALIPLFTNWTTASRAG